MRRKQQKEKIKNITAKGEGPDGNDDGGCGGSCGGGGDDDDGGG